MPYKLALKFPTKSFRKTRHTWSILAPTSRLTWILLNGIKKQPFYAFTSDVTWIVKKRQQYAVMLTTLRISSAANRWGKRFVPLAWFCAFSSSCSGRSARLAICCCLISFYVKSFWQPWVSWTINVGWTAQSDEKFLKNSKRVLSYLKKGHTDDILLCFRYELSTNFLNYLN